MLIEQGLSFMTPSSRTPPVRGYPERQLKAISNGAKLSLLAVKRFRCLWLKHDMVIVLGLEKQWY